MAIDVNKDCFIRDRWDNMGWKWSWRRPLRTSREQCLLDELCAMIPSSLDTNNKDRWEWNLKGKKEFSVVTLRQCIDHNKLPIDPSKKINWNPLVPKKVNIFIWRLRRNCLPTGLNLFAKGIDITTARCFLCQGEVEDMIHLTQTCKITSGVRNLLSDWTRSDIPNLPCEDILTWCSKLKINKKHRNRLEAILYVWWWYMWKARNNSLHNHSQESCLEIFSAICSLAFHWIHNRDRKDSLTWDEWNEHPIKTG